MISLLEIDFDQLKPRWGKTANYIIGFEIFSFTHGSLLVNSKKRNEALKEHVIVAQYSPQLTI